MSDLTFIGLVVTCLVILVILTWYTIRQVWRLTKDDR